MLYDAIMTMQGHASTAVHVASFYAGTGCETGMVSTLQNDDC